MAEKEHATQPQVDLPDIHGEASVRFPRSLVGTGQHIYLPTGTNPGWSIGSGRGKIE